MRDLLDLTDKGTGGSFLQVRNTEFSEWSAGPRNAPDGWSAVAGSFGVDLVQESADVRSGNYALRIIGETAVIRSDLFPLEGDENTPYTFAWVHKNLAGTVADPRVRVEFYERDRTTLIVSQILINTVTGVAAADGWFTTVKDGVEPQPLAAFARVTIENNPAADATTENGIDAIIIKRTSRETAFGLDITNPSWGLVSTSNDPYNQPWGQNTISAFPYDYGNQAVNDSGSPGVNNGYHFLVREAGRYDITMSAYPNLGGDGGADRELRWEFVKNGTYDSALNGQRVSGQVLADRTRIRAQTSPANQLTDATVLTYSDTFEAGDRISADLVRLAPSNRSIRLGNGIAGLSKLKITKRAAD